MEQTPEEKAFLGGREEKYVSTSRPGQNLPSGKMVLRYSSYEHYLQNNPIPPLLPLSQLADDIEMCKAIIEAADLTGFGFKSAEIYKEGTVKISMGYDVQLYISATDIIYKNCGNIKHTPNCMSIAALISSRYEREKG